MTGLDDNCTALMAQYPKSSTAFGGRYKHGSDVDTCFEPVAGEAGGAADGGAARRLQVDGLLAQGQGSGSVKEGAAAAAAGVYAASAAASSSAASGPASGPASASAGGGGSGGGSAAANSSNPTGTAYPTYCAETFRGWADESFDLAVSQVWDGGGVLCVSGLSVRVCTC